MQQKYVQYGILILLLAIFLAFVSWLAIVIAG